jgi:hypothetical protein
MPLEGMPEQIRVSCDEFNTIMAHFREVGLGIASGRNPWWSL